MQKAFRYPASRPSWLWALLPLLLAAALVAPILGRDVFDIDEAATMLNAGARHLGPFTPAEAVHTSVSRSPDQAWGHVVVLAVGAYRGLERAGDSQPALAHRIAHPCLGLPYRPRPVHSACCPDGHAAVVNIRRLSHLYAQVKILRVLDALRGNRPLGLLARGPESAPARTRRPGRPGAGRDRVALRPLLRRAAAARAGALPSSLCAQGAALVAAGVIARPGRAARPATSA